MFVSIIPCQGYPFSISMLNTKSRHSRGGTTSTADVVPSTAHLANNATIHTSVLNHDDDQPPSTPEVACLAQTAGSHS